MSRSPSNCAEVVWEDGSQQGDGCTHAKMALDHAVDVGRAVLEELDMVAGALLEDDDGDVDGAEDTELVGFFEETVLALRAGEGMQGKARRDGVEYGRVEDCQENEG